MLTPAEKRQNKIERTEQDFRRYSNAKACNKVAAIFQRWVKLSAADENGICQCVTCGARHPWNSNKLNAGHYYSRRHKQTLLEPKNCHPQCVYCNCYLHGNLIAYTKWMQANYTKKELDWLDREHRKTGSLSFEELAARKVDLLEMVRQEKKRIGA